MMVSAISLIWIESVPAISISLFGLGLGWNFSFVAATAELADRTRPAERGKMLGFNDLLSGGTGAALALMGGAGALRDRGRGARDRGRRAARDARAVDIARLAPRRVSRPSAGCDRRRSPGKGPGMLRRGIAGIVALVALLVPSSASADYVALGDSFAAGPLIPLQIQPFGCLKSNNNYAHVAQRRLRFAEFRDASCSGAETEDMTQAQGVTPGPNPPQFDRLQPDTELVTINIGGNDIGFSSIAEDCFTFQRRAPPAGTSTSRTDGTRSASGSGRRRRWWRRCSRASTSARRRRACSC